MASTIRNFCTRMTRTKPIDTEPTQLVRCLNTFDLTFLGVGATVGAGLYVVTGEVAKNVAGPSIVLSYFIAAVAALLSGVCYAEFGCRVHKAGSAYLYTYCTVGEFWAFVIGWNMILEYVIGSASLGRAASQYIDSMVGGALHNFTEKHIGSWNAQGLGSYPDFLAFFLVVLMCVVVSCGVKKSTTFNKVVTFVNLTVITFIIVVGMFYIDNNNWSKDVGFMPYGTSGVFAGAASCFYAFVGFDVIATASEETKNPKRSIPLSILLCLLIAFLAYFGVSTILTLIVPYNKLDELAPLPEAFAQRGMHWAKYIIDIGGLCALFGSLLGSTFAVPRIIYSMASDGLLFKFLGKVNDKTSIPVRAVLASGSLASILSFCLDLDQLVEMLSIGTLMAYSLVAASVLILRFQPNVESTTDDTPSSGRRSCPACFGNPSNVDYEKIETDTQPQPVPSKVPDEHTSRIAAASVAMMCVAITGLLAVLIFSWSSVEDGRPWAAVTMSFCALLLFVAIGYMQLQPRNNARFPFMVPFVPILPIASLTINIFLLLKLNHWTWVRFTIWMTLGFLVYFFYSMSHSIEETGNTSTGGEASFLDDGKTIIQPYSEKIPLQPLTSTVPYEEVVTPENGNGTFEVYKAQPE